jgi:hypothetical protein
METKFTHAGVSTLNGQVKIRFANGAGRVSVLAKNGHKNIDLTELMRPMTKTEAINALLKANFDAGDEQIKNLLLAELKKQSKK